ncbi:hypothetical protein FHG87_014842 [Trinorchestia longiramus]|nr:hypothetical protein FHG87_014842 [Trinorchestia longiramus]
MLRTNVDVQAMVCLDQRWGACCLKATCSLLSHETSVSQSGPYRPPGGVEEMQGGGRRVRLEWGAYITV